MLVVPKDGSAAKSFNLDDIRHIDFLGEGNTFSVECAADRWSYDFDWVRCLKFDGLVNDIATATKQESAVSIAYREGQIFVSGLGNAQLTPRFTTSMDAAASVCPTMMVSPST